MSSHHVLGVAFFGAVVVVAMHQTNDGTVVRPSVTLPTNDQTCCVAFAPDNRSVAAASGKALQLWEVTNATRPIVSTAASPFANTDVVTSVAFRPDGRYVATAEASGRIKLWDASTGRHAASTDGTMDAPIRALQFSPDNAKLVASVGGVLVMFDGSSLRRMGEIDIADESLTPMLYTADGSTLVTWSDFGTVRFFDASSRRETRRWTLSGAPVEHCTATEDAGLVACAIHFNQATIYAGANGKVDAIITVPDTTITAMKFSPDRSLLAIATRDHAIRIYDSASARKIGTLLGHTDAPLGIAFSTDSVLLASGAATSALIWNVPR